MSLLYIQTTDSVTKFMAIHKLWLSLHDNGSDLFSYLCTRLPGVTKSKCILCDIINYDKMVYLMSVIATSH